MDRAWFIQPESLKKIVYTLVILRNMMFIYQTHLVAWDQYIADKDQIYNSLCFGSG